MVRAPIVAVLVTVLAGCSAMLPSSREVSASRSGWQKFADAEKTFESIVPGKTTVEELKALKLDPSTNPSVTRLQNWQVRERFIPNTLVQLEDLDVGVRECIQAREACKAYEVNYVSTQTTRTGNVALDVLKLQRTTRTAGFRFNGLILVKDNVVVYTLTAGQPRIQTVEDKQDYLGPIQTLASKLKLDAQVANLKDTFMGNKGDQPAAAPDSAAVGIAVLKK